MRSIGWIAADLTRDLLTRPGLLAMAISVVTLIPLQAGLIDGALSRMIGPHDSGVHLLVTTSALCPAMASVILFTGILLPRQLNHEMEPLLATPVTDRAIALGCALPFFAASVLGSAPAAGFTILGLWIAGGPPPSAAVEWLDLLLAAQVPTSWIACALIRSLRRIASPWFTALNVITGVVALMILDAAMVLWRFHGGPARPRMLLALAILSAIGPAWAFARRIDRDALIRIG